MRLFQANSPAVSALKILLRQGTFQTHDAFDWQAAKKSTQ